jgi:hypothetical protein
MLAPSLEGPNIPDAGTSPFQTAPQPRMLASVNIADSGAGQTSRPT